MAIIPNNMGDEYLKAQRLEGVKMTQDQAREKLLPMNLRRVSDESGVDKQALYRFSWGRQLSPDNFELLVAWLERYGK